MAGITGEHLPAAEISFVDLRHHQNHSASSLFFFSIFSRIVFPSGIAAMAILTGVAQRGGKKAHGGHKLIYRQIGQHCDVLEELAGSERFLFRRGLRLRKSIPEQVKNRRGSEK